MLDTNGLDFHKRLFEQINEENLTKTVILDKLDGNESFVGLNPKNSESASGFLAGNLWLESFCVSMKCREKNLKLKFYI